MTETPQQGRPPEAAQAEPDPNSLNTEHLRNYTQLRRTTYDRKIAGVAGGLARHLNIDPVIVRVLFVVLCFFGGAGFVLYGAAWLIVPDDTGRPARFHTSDSTRNALLIIAGVCAALLLVGDSWGGFGFPWPLALIGLVVFAVLMTRDNRPVDPNAPAPYVAPPPGAPYAGGDQTLPLGQPVQPVQPVQPMKYTGQEYGWQPVAPQLLKPRKQGPILFGITLAILAAAFGSLGIYDSGTGNYVADAAYPALALAVIGAMLVVGSFYGRPGGLVFLGVIASFALAGSAIAGPRYDGDRDQELVPTFSSQVKSAYEVPAGRISLDLSKVSDPAELNGRTISLEANAGELVVVLPPHVGANVNADISIAGAIDLPGHSADGFGPTLDQNMVVPNEQGRVTLNLDLRFGHIEVREAA